MSSHLFITIIMWTMCAPQVMYQARFPPETKVAASGGRLVMKEAEAVGFFDWKCAKVTQDLSDAQ